MLCTAILDQSAVFHTIVTIARNDDVVVDGYIEGFGGADDLLCHVDVGLGWFWIAAGVVVHEDNCGCAKFERAFHDFTGIGGGVVDGSRSLDFVAD